LLYGLDDDDDDDDDDEEEEYTNTTSASLPLFNHIHHLLSPLILHHNVSPSLS
jgi:hypothetical protein